MGNMKVWNALKQPPPDALKTIRGGRLKGMTDINPQWRYQALTEQFGMCGVGWKYQVNRTWSEPGGDGQIFAFAEVMLFVLNERDTWSDPIPGIGGSMLVAKEKDGLYSSDEAYKMAITDALSVAMKMIGVAADIYMGKSDSKYKKSTDTPSKKSKEMSSKQWYLIKKIAEEKEGMTEDELIGMVKWKAGQENLIPRHWKMAKFLIPEDNFEKVFIEYSEFQMGGAKKVGLHPGDDYPDKFDETAF